MTSPKFFWLKSRGTGLSGRFASSNFNDILNDTFEDDSIATMKRASTDSVDKYNQIAFRSINSLPFSRSKKRRKSEAEEGNSATNKIDWGKQLYFSTSFADIFQPVFLLKHFLNQFNITVIIAVKIFQIVFESVARFVKNLISVQNVFTLELN